MMKIIDWLLNLSDSEPPPWYYYTFVAIFTILFEWLYFTSAGEVRLLYVLLIIIPGFIIGFIVAEIVKLVPGFLALGIVGGLVIGAIGGFFYLMGELIEFLHNTVIWKNE